MAALFHQFYGDDTAARQPARDSDRQQFGDQTPQIRFVADNNDLIAGGEGRQELAQIRHGVLFAKKGCNLDFT